MKKKKVLHLCSLVCCLVLGILVIFPMLYTFCNSFMKPAEIMQHYISALHGSGGGTIEFHMIPDQFSLEGYYTIFLRSTKYLMKFWYSLALCLLISGGQMIVSVFGGFAFAKYPIPFKRGILFVLMILMLMPVQVTLVPNYIILDELNLLDTWMALILPMTFLPFGTVFLTQIFKKIPDEVLDAARLDGANTFQILKWIVVPIGKGGIIGIMLLSFVDTWNMVEQPVTFLKDIFRYPLSVFLASVNDQNFPLSFVCGVLVALPVILLFIYFNEELIEGIESSGMK